MKTKLFYIVAIATLFLSCQKSIQPLSISSKVDSPAQISRPNIILIPIDDMGYEVPTCNGGKSYETPNIDALAAGGIRFTNCHANCVCSPSRFMLMTGKYNFRNYHEWGVMDTTNKTFGNLLDAAGYTCGFYGKDQLSGGASTLKAFKFFQYVVHDPAGAGAARGNRYKDGHGYYKNYYLTLPPGTYLPDVAQDSMITFIKRISANSNRKFFAYYPAISVHEPFEPTPDDAEYASWTPGNSDVKFYPSMVKYLDKKIGQLMDSLNALGLLENTIIILTADNGTPQKVKQSIYDSLYDYGLYGHNIFIDGGKLSTTEYGTHVPLIVYWKGHIIPHVDTSLISFVDFLPTLADIAVTQIPSSYGVIDGISFYPQITGTTPNFRDNIYCWYQHNPELNSPIFSWMQDAQGNKLYDSSFNYFNIKSDALETSPISPIPSQDTVAYNKLKQNLLNIH